MDCAFALEPDIAVELRTHGRDHALAALARRQHAIAARRQLVALGFSRHAIGRMIAKGQLHAVHRGIYAVGPARLTREARWRAAVLAAGPSAVLSHRSAAALWQLVLDRFGDIEVTTARRGHPQPGIRIHFAHLAGDEITTVDGIPVTTAARTLLDAAALPLAPPPRTSHARGGGPTPVGHDRPALPHRPPSTSPRHPGLARDSRSPRLGRTIIKSEFELRFLSFLADNKFPRPETNSSVSTAVTAYECDVVWPQARLIVELDGYETHGTRKRFEEGRARDRALGIAGWRVIRITWRQLRDEPRELARDLWELLGRAPAAVVCGPRHA